MSAAPLPRGEPGHIVWVVDDDPDDLTLARVRLRRCPLVRDVVTVPNPRRALELLSEPGQVPPAVIFLDLNMPSMSGIEFLARLSMLTFDRRPRVVAVSGDLRGLDHPVLGSHPDVVARISKPLSDVDAIRALRDD